MSATWLMRAETAMSRIEMPRTRRTPVKMSCSRCICSGAIATSGSSAVSIRSCLSAMPVPPTGATQAVMATPETRRQVSAQVGEPSNEQPADEIDDEKSQDEDDDDRGENDTDAEAAGL